MNGVVQRIVILSTSVVVENQV